MGTSDENRSSLLHDLTRLQDPSSMAVFSQIAFDAVVAFDAQERITSWNPAAGKMFGWTAEEVLGKTPAELFWPVDTTLEEENKIQRQTRLKQGKTLAGQLISCRKDGSTFLAQYTARAIFDSGGELSGYLAVYRDISAQVQAHEKELELERSNQKLNEILTSIQDDFYVLDRNWVFVFTSRSFTSKIGKEPKDFVGNNIWEMFPRHLGTILEENFRATMEKREIRRFEIPGKYTNAWYRMTSFPSVEGITVIGTDITESKRSEQALQESEERYRRIIDSTHEGIWMLDLNGITTYVNTQLAAMLGHTPEEMIGRYAFDFVISDDIARGQEEWEKRRIESDGRQSVYGYRHRDGHVVWCLVNSSSIVDAQGKSIGILGMFSDISERMLAEQALRESEERYRNLVKYAPSAIYEIDLKTMRFTEVNDTMGEILGYTSEELLSMTPEELLEEKSRERFRERICQTLAGEKISEKTEYKVRARDGHELWAIFNSTLNSDHGKLKSVSVIAHDITERKRAEEALRESEKQLQLLNESLEQKIQEKTAEIRRLASDTTRAVQRERSRISHILHDDLQQRIYAIQMQLTFLRYELQTANEAARNELSDVEKHLAEILEITRHLSIDLSPPILHEEGLSHAISWLAGQMRQRYGLLIDVQADEPFAIPQEELHVFLFNCIRELLFNIVKHAEATRAVVALHWLDADLQIEVSDDGRGFSVDQPEMMLSPKMSLEESPEPSFGLPTIGQQLSLFGGRMEIRSEPGIGTRVILIAPVDRVG